MVESKITTELVTFLALLLLHLRSNLRNPKA